MKKIILKKLFLVVLFLLGWLPLSSQAYTVSIKAMCVDEAGKAKGIKKASVLVYLADENDFVLYSKQKLTNSQGGIKISTPKPGTVNKKTKNKYGNVQVDFSLPNGDSRHVEYPFLPQDNKFLYDVQYFSCTQ